VLRRLPKGSGNDHLINKSAATAVHADRFYAWGLVTSLAPSMYHPGGWKMAPRSRELRGMGSDSEKITINLGYVDLGRIDVLVQEQFYANRSDFIRTAIRNQLAVHADAVSRSIDRHTLDLGLRDYSRADLEAVKAEGQRLHIKVVGLARIASDVTPELALATIGSITVLGALQASPAVKAALAERIK
jgi:Arc/MetJ-type ribon-helix-helix transcriptional regulator